MNPSRVFEPYKQKRESDSEKNEQHALEIQRLHKIIQEQRQEIEDLKKDHKSKLFKFYK